MTETEFTPAAAILGGAVVGLAVLLLMLGNGRIAGISGIAAGALGSAPPGDRAWRWAFLAGLVIGGLTYAMLVAPVGPTLDTPSQWLPAIAGAVIVGFGTRLGSGCTSGHGICGVSRVSARSLIATTVFMASGTATVFIVRHVI